MQFTRTAQQLLSVAVKDAHFPNFPEYDAWPIIDKHAFNVTQHFIQDIWEQYLKVFFLSGVTTGSGGDAILMDSFPIMPGTQEHISLESSDTSEIEQLKSSAGVDSLALLKKFRSTAHHNKNKIVWAWGGEYIYLAKGSSLLTYGSTFAIRLVRKPAPISDGGSIVEIQDGILTDMVTAFVRHNLATRYTGSKSDPAPDISRLVREYYGSRVTEKEAIGIQEKLLRAV